METLMTPVWVMAALAMGLAMIAWRFAAMPRLAYATPGAGYKGKKGKYDGDNGGSNLLLAPLSALRLGAEPAPRPMAPLQLPGWPGYIGPLEFCKRPTPDCAGFDEDLEDSRKAEMKPRMSHKARRRFYEEAVSSFEAVACPDRAFMLKVTLKSRQPGQRSLIDAAFDEVYGDQAPIGPSFDA